MNSERDPLDGALASLPRDIAPSRDLWTGIQAAIHAAPPAVSSRSPARFWQLAAAVLLMMASSAITYVMTRQSLQIELLQAQRSALLAGQALRQNMPANFGGQEPLDGGYLQARASLDGDYLQKIKQLPPVTRARLERSLADLRRAASEISAMLARHPSDPLLQELLLSTYQSELALMAGVNEMTVTSGAEL